MQSIGEQTAYSENDVVTLAATSTVSDAIGQLAGNNISAVVVIDDAGAPVGVFSERDIIKALAESGTDAVSETVDTLMTTDIISCAPSDGLFAAISRMLSHGIRHLLILDDGALRGVVTIRDLLSALVEKERNERELLVELVGEIRNKFKGAIPNAESGGEPRDDDLKRAG